jgi:hypothetical protein
MATLAELVGRQELVRLGGGLLPNEQVQGRLYAFPHVIDWFENVLPVLQSELGDGRQDPLEQVDDLVHDFVAGTNLDYWERSHSMRPEVPGVWELKTPDVRLFGWFHLRLTFVIAEVNTAFKCKKHDLYPGYRDSVIRRRDALDLNEPKFITGSYEDVL